MKGLLLARGKRHLTVVNKPDWSESPQRSEDFKRKAGLKTAKGAELYISNNC